MNVASTSSMKRKTLQAMTKAELRNICDTLDIEYEKGDTNATLIERIKESGKYNPTTERGVRGVVVDKTSGKRVHPQLGEYKRVIVHARDPKEGSIFASINLYTVEFQPGEEIELPEKMIQFLKKASKIEHYYDPNQISENGNVGVHTYREVPRYIIETVD